MGIFELLADVSGTRGLRFLVIGGHAINAYGYSRETGDLDILVCRDDRAAWLSWFLSIDYTLFRDAGTFLQLDAPPACQWPVDVMLVAEPSFSDMFAASVRLEDHPTRPRIPSLDHLLALKLHALKHTRIHRFLKDFQDVVGLIECQKLDPDSEKLRQLFEKYGTMDLYEKVRRALS